MNTPTCCSKNLPVTFLVQLLLGSITVQPICFVKLSLKIASSLSYHSLVSEAVGCMVTAWHSRWAINRHLEVGSFVWAGRLTDGERAMLFGTLTIFNLLQPDFYIWSTWDCFCVLLQHCWATSAIHFSNLTLAINLVPSFAFHLLSSMERSKH